MTRIKLCGLSRPCDIQAANALRPEYIGFVFAPKSRRYVSFVQAAELKRMLDPAVQAVGVFVNEPPENVAALLEGGVIDIAQLHGGEGEDYIKQLRALTDKPILQAFRVESAQDIANAEHSSADLVLLDAGSGGTGTVFDWALIGHLQRPYFLAGGLDVGNVTEAIRALHPYAVDVSTGVETAGIKDQTKMAAFVAAVRKEESI